MHYQVWVEVLYANVLLSYIGNGFLVYLILCKTRNDMGLYINILMTYGIMNLVSQTSKIFTSPIVITYNRGFFFLPVSPILVDHPRAAFHFILLCFCLFTVCIFMMSLHFLYRYCVICRPSFLSNISHRQMRLSLIGMILSIMIVSAAAYKSTLDLSEELKEYMHGPFEEFLNVSRSDYGAIGANYDSWLIDGSSHTSIKAFVSLAYITFFVSVSGGTVTFCISRIFMELQFGARLSEKTKKIQMDMMKALILQGCLPVAFQLLPLTIAAVCPFFGFDITGFPLPTIASFHPVIEPIIIIYFVKDYRRAVKGLLRSVEFLRNRDVARISSVSTTYLQSGKF